ncbi:MAG: hypothetical protein U0L20_06240 [Ruminococcus sp.]|nr:hypothetical protein [Ruminococcus sp.]
MTKGFITIATGNKYYYEIAANLLMSYRYFSKEPLPFAIIAEEHNEYTALFDDVIITNESTHSFMDKLLLLKLCPYDETIFFDADSLAFGDLNKYWDAFKNATDFSAIGEDCDREDRTKAWYYIEDIGKYGENVSYKSRVHAGVCFIRNSPKTKKFYEDCLEICNNFDKLHFHTCQKSKDECVLAVAMPMNDMKTTKEEIDMLATYPCLTHIEADIFRGYLKCTTQWNTSTENGILVHWGTAHTHDIIYKYNAACLKYCIRYKNEKAPLFYKIWYENKLGYLRVRCVQKLRNIRKSILQILHK